MGKQKAFNTIKQFNNNEQEIKKIVDLEKKYQKLLWNIFSAAEFKTDLLEIEKDIQTNYSFLHEMYGPKNKLKIAAERLVRSHVIKSPVYRKFWSSSISGDLAFETEDAIINIDIKTIDVIGNAGDTSSIQFQANQYSFINKPIRGVVPSRALKIHDKDKPVLSYFITIIYEDRLDKQSFYICRNSQYETVHLVNLPNGYTSEVYDYDLISNIKSYKYNEEARFETPLEWSSQKEAQQYLETHYADSTKYIVYSHGLKAKDENIVWKITTEGKGSNKKTILKQLAKASGSMRIPETVLQDRLDSVDQSWDGVNKYTIK